MLKLLQLIIGLLLVSIPLLSHGTTLQSIGYIVKTCSIDLNKDGKKDIATLYEKQNQRSIELRLSSKKKTYVYDIVKQGEGKFDLTMECKKGHTVTQGKSVNKNQPKIKIPKRAYLEVIFPESSSSIYYYERQRLKKKWILD